MNTVPGDHSFDKGFAYRLVTLGLSSHLHNSLLLWNGSHNLVNECGTPFKRRFCQFCFVDFFRISNELKRQTLQPFFAAQSVMSSTGVLCNFVFAFCMGKFASNIQTAINKSGLYFLAAGINIFGLIFCMIFVPETKGKTPEEIKKYFQKGFQKVPA